MAKETGFGLGHFNAVWYLGFDRRLHLRASFPATVVREGRLLYAAADLVER